MGLFKEWGDPGNGEGDDSELGGGRGEGVCFYGLLNRGVFRTLTNIKDRAFRDNS